MEVHTYDLEQSIYDGLRALPADKYLCAMRAAIGRLANLYGRRLSDHDRELIRGTIQMVDDALAAKVNGAGRPTTPGSSPAWWQLIDDRAYDASAGPGVSTMRRVCRSLVLEIVQEARPYLAAEYVDQAVSLFWWEPGPWGFTIDEPDQIRDESHAHVVVLRELVRAVDFLQRATPEDRAL